MKRIVSTLLLAFLLLSGTHINAQDEQNCDPVAVKEWLIQRQAWINATEDVLNAQGMGIPNAQINLYTHLQAIEDLPMPECVSPVMLQTYFFYTQVQHLLVCAQQNNSTCITDMQSRVATYRNTIDETIAPLASMSGFSSLEYVNLRPEGWSLGTQPTTSEDQSGSEVGDGSRQNPYALGTWASFGAGRFRVAAVNQNYQPQSGLFYEQKPDMQIIAVTLEWECQPSDSSESCSFFGFETGSINYVTPDGNALESIDVYDDPWYLDQEGFAGAILRGNIYFEKSITAPLGLLRAELSTGDTFDWENVFFSLQ
jgi:hypothetical protein